MKTICRLTGIVSLMLILSTSLAYAENLLFLKVDNASPSETVKIPMLLQSKSRISALSSDIIFNFSELKFEYAEIGPAAKGKHLISNMVKNGTLRLGLISMDNTEIINGNVLNIVFSVNSEAKPGNILIRQKASASNPEGESIKIKGKNAKMAISY